MQTSQQVFPSFLGILEMKGPISWIIQQRALVILSLITSILVLLPLPGFIKSKSLYDSTQLMPADSFERP